jgi:prophage tail gpP-like protein
VSEPDDLLDEVTLKIEQEEFHGWDELELHQGLDSMPSVGFQAPFDPESLPLRQRFRPYGFQQVEVAIGGARAFNGVMMPPEPDVEAGKCEMTVSAYSRAAELARSDVPASLIPMESAGLSLSDIARRLAGPFGVDVIMRGSEGANFRRVKTKQKKVDGKVEAGQKILDFLGELARQRMLVMTGDVDGNLLFWQSVASGNPVVSLVQGEQPLVKVAVSFNPEDYYSELTGYTTTKHGRVGAKYTERNQRLAGGILRAHSFRLDDIEKGDGPAAVKAKLGRMFASCVSYTATVPTWRDPKGNLFKPNTTVTLFAPKAMVYKETEFLVRDVYFKRGRAEGKHATLGLVLPGAFSGQAPDRMPWDE